MIQHHNFITCLSRINKSLDEDKAVSVVLVGTESKELHVLETSGMSIKKTYTLKSVPCFL